VLEGPAFTFSLLHASSLRAGKGLNIAYSDDSDHPFRGKAATDSRRFGPPIPMKATTDSGGSAQGEAVPG